MGDGCRFAPPILRAANLRGLFAFIEPYVEVNIDWNLGKFHKQLMIKHWPAVTKGRRPETHNAHLTSIMFEFKQQLPLVSKLTCKPMDVIPKIFGVYAL
jgi:hypothetical protein